MRLARVTLPMITLVVVTAAFSSCRKKKDGDDRGSSKACTPAQSETGDGETEAAAGASLADCATETENSGTKPVEGDSESDTGYKSKEGHGCLQGVVIDGFSGQRVDLSALTDPAGVYVLIRDKKLKAQTHTGDPNLVGEYFICDIPVEETYPVYAYLDGYLPFESTVKISSTRPLRTTNDGAYTEEVSIPDPMVLTNIQLFPKANAGRDLVVTVRHEGKPVKDAFVDLEPKAAVGHFSFEGTFANSAGTRMLPMRKSTDEDGKATFPAADLALGANYGLTVVSPVAVDLGTNMRTIVLGVSGATADDQDNWSYHIDLGDQERSLRAISCSKLGESYNSQGSIQIVFNRDVSLTDNDDAWTAALSGTQVGGAALPSDTPNNGASERVAASTSGNTLVLKPKFTGGTAPVTPDYSKAKNDAQNVDIDVAVTYTGNSINLRVTGDATQNSVALSSVANLATVCGSTSPSIRLFKEY